MGGYGGNTPTVGGYRPNVGSIKPQYSSFRPNPGNFAPTNTNYRPDTPAFGGFAPSRPAGGYSPRKSGFGSISSIANW